jgi:isocitrate lyase
VASLLNTAHPDVAFTYSDTAELVAAVNAALATNDRAEILALATMLDDDNNLGCSIDAHGNPIVVE